MSPVFRHGRLRLYLLKLLDEAPRHGYEVIRLLQDRFMGVYAPSPGTIYPRLARLEEEGLVTHDEADGRKVYRITDKGREELRARLDDLTELEEEITASVRDIAREVTEDVRETVRTLREELTWAAREFHTRARQTGGGADPGGDAPHARTDEARARAAAARYREAARAREAEEAARAAAAAQAEAAAAEHAARSGDTEGAGGAWAEATARADEATRAGEAARAERAGRAGDASRPGGEDVSGARHGVPRDREDVPHREDVPGDRGDPHDREDVPHREDVPGDREDVPGDREDVPGGRERGGRDRRGRDRGGRDRGGREWGEWAGWTGWGGWPGAAGHHGWADPDIYRDLERVARQFSRDLRSAAGQAQAVSEDALRDLREILDETINRIKSEVFRGTPPDPGQDSGTPPRGDA